MSMPIICARSRNLSLGCLPVIISASRNSACPPSSAGIGKMFMNASMIERNAVINQNSCQSQVAGKRLPIDANIPTDFAPSDVNTYLKSLTYPRRTSKPNDIPAGNDAKKP